MVSGRGPEKCHRRGRRADHQRVRQKAGAAPRKPEGKPPAPIDLDEILEVERLVPGGWGLTHGRQGGVALLPRAAPGDRVRPVRITRRAGIAVVPDYDLLVAGRGRTPPSCPLADRCGGCDFMHLELEAQRCQKRQLLLAALDRSGGSVDESLVEALVVAGAPLGYRTRIGLHLDEVGNIGMRSLRSSHVVPVDHCPVVTTSLGCAVERLASLVGAGRKHLRALTRIELRSPAAGEAVATRLFFRNPSEPCSRELQRLLGDLGPVTTAGTAVEQTTYQTMNLPGSVSLRIPLGTFFQVNEQVNWALVSAVVQGTLARGLGSFVDPFAGAGNFGLPLLHAGLSGHLGDIEPQGVLAARAAARDAGFPHHGFEIGAAETVLRRAAARRQSFDLVLLDPPRRGAFELLSASLELHPRYLALVACDPVSLARDLAGLVQRGCTVESLVPFDMFPQTHHVETLAWVRAP